VLHQVARYTQGEEVMAMRRSKIEEIPVGAIQGNSILAVSVGHRELERCERTIREYGLLNPVVVQKCAGEHYQVLPGECKRMVLARMRRRTVPAVVLESLAEPEATRLVLLLSSLQRSPNALSEGLLLKELCRDGRHTQVEAALMVGRSVSWVNKRLALAERLAVGVVELVRAGRLCPPYRPGNRPTARRGAANHGQQSDHRAFPKSMAERLVSTYNNPEIPEEIKKSVLGNPRAVLSLLAKVQKSRSPKAGKEADPRSLARHRLQNALALLCRLTGEAEGLCAGLPLRNKQALGPMLLQCAQALERFGRLARSHEPSGFSPGNK
jgi:ParB family chromosome partitioning protein